MNRLVAFGPVLALALIACGPSQSAPQAASSAPKSGGMLNVRQPSDPAGWDNTITNNVPTKYGIAIAYDSLLGFKRDPDLEYMHTELQPELAERWEIAPDSRSFTFHLRQGAKFQNVSPVNGREVTSGDVKFSAEYRLRLGEFGDRKLPKGEVDYFYEGLDRIETPDRYTAVFHFKEPFVPFINYAASDWNPIYPREVYDKDGTFQETLIGTGPYMLDEAGSQKGSRWGFKKNPDYWNAGKPYLDTVRWLVLPQEATAYAAFQTMQLDMLFDLNFQAAQEVLKASPQAQSFKFLQPNATDLLLSQAPERNSPLRDQRIRRALSLAIDRDELNRTFFDNQGEWGLPAAPQGLFTQDEARQLLRQEVEEATRLVREAGYANGVTLETPMNDDEERINIATIELVQAQIKRAGINIEIKPTNRVDASTKLRRGDFDISPRVGQGSGIHDDPASYQFGRFYSKATNNSAKINDPEIDRLLEASRREADPEKRREIMRAVTRRAVDMTWSVLLLYRPKWHIWQPYVREYWPNYGPIVDYEMVWLEKK